VTRLGALLRLRCPVCRKAPIFSGAMSMHSRCANCGYVYEREPGYFLGAIAIGYALAVPVVAGLGFLVHALAPSMDWTLAFVIGFILYLGVAPAGFRYSRGIWMYIDNWLDPPDKPAHL
jgi:uncharacterized protein (DUF983 family)